VVSSTAMTIRRMALRVSTEPKGPPVPMAYFLSLRSTPPPGLARRLLWSRPASKGAQDVQDHANAGITLGRYDHLLPGSEAEAA
jgi:hypothetical protein